VDARVRHRRARGYLQTTIGLAALAQDRLDDAEREISLGLSASLAANWHYYAWVALCGLASVAVRRGDLERAALLLGAAQRYANAASPASATSWPHE
jgi:ATP/maltotriose-dependent transcriptional regulator MalT